jgi:nitroreductase
MDHSRRSGKVQTNEVRAMEFQELVHKRRMVRHFKPDTVPRDVLLRILEVARHAPSAGFSQGFDFVVLDDAQKLDAFWTVIEHPKFPYAAEDIAGRPPCVVLAISNRSAYLERYSRPDKEKFGLQKAEAWPVSYWDVDTGMAVMLVLLAAVEEGLGAVFFGLPWGVERLMHDLGVPEGCRPIGALSIGYPKAGAPRVGSAFSLRRRTLESMVHFGRWSGDADAT